jgi:hypothetical protein
LADSVDSIEKRSLVVWGDIFTRQGRMVEKNKGVNPMANAVMVIEPHWNSGTWVFDDEAVELDREPFGEGIPQMIDDLVQDIPDARGGFRLLFSSAPFSGYQLELNKVSEDFGGHWYLANGTRGQGCLCPAMCSCFEIAPERLYLKAEPIGHAVEGDPAELTALRNRVEELERVVYRLTMENETLKMGQDPPPPEYLTAGNEERW